MCLKQLKTLTTYKQCNTGNTCQLRKFKQEMPI